MIRRSRNPSPSRLSLLAIDFPKFGQEIVRQWSAQRDGDLKVTHVTLQQWDSAEVDLGDFDLIVHPQIINFDLISEKQIRTLSKKAIENEELNRSAFLPHFRKAMVRHGDETWGVSLGDHPLRLFYRKDILAAAGLEPPELWEDMQSAIDKLSKSESANGMKILSMPGTDAWPTRIFLARAASAIRGRGKLTTFFDRKKMTPTISAEPFVEALIETKKLYDLSGDSLTLEESFELFANGKSVFSIGWPAFGEETAVSDFETDSVNWGVMRLPGTRESYDLSENRWVKRDNSTEVQVDYFGLGSYNISVASGTAKSRDAIAFIVWLTEKSNSQKLLPGIAAPFRATHLANLDRWYPLDQVDRNFSDQFADTITEAHRENIFLMFPQIRGSHKYLQVLQDGVLGFLNDEGSDAKKALGTVAEKWESMTEEYGRNRQVRALRKGNDI